MSDFLERIEKLSPKRLALLALELKEKVDALEARAREPLAIVGMGCRLPGGADDPEAYWELLRAGRDATREVPPDRWDAAAWYDADPDVPGRIVARRGGFLDRLDGFDAAHFGISAREALTMDPQQRLLLEVSWEALEHAGLSPERLAGTATGVFVGVCNSDHFQRMLTRGPETLDAYIASGNAHSVAAGRISYCLGLNGPAVAVDTACSSSLVALHLACQSLRRGESRVALAAGVNVMCSPETAVALSRGHMLAPDGRCKTFDAAADGFARGEGCGVLVLKRLSDAEADGDRVLALVRGTAINQDGRSGGLTVPSGPAQEAVIRAALEDAGVAPAEVGYVEAHGTGTTLGDPIEIRALGNALRPGRPAGDPVVVGSVKTNLGHLESAAGVAGVMKVVLSLQHEHIPPHLHFRTPSPQIAWADHPVVVEAQGRAWPRGARRRLAGVSSFGFSGTNGHVILEEAAPPAFEPSSPDRPVHVLPLSARTPEALTALAARQAAALAAPGVALADAAHTLGVGRSHLAERLAVVARDAAGARAALEAFARGEPAPAARRGTCTPGQPPEVVFLFTGQGAQYPGMGKALYEAAPVYRELIDRCDAALGAGPDGRTLRAVLEGPAGDDAPIHQTAWTQPALFALEVALAGLWRSFGIEPAGVIGHSLGEYAAACVAGVFGVEEGVRLAAERGRLMQALPPGGTMAAIFAPVAELEAAVAPYADRVAIAAVNAPDSAVISGEAATVEALLAGFARRNVQGHRLYVSLAGHSPLVAPALAPLEAAARAVPMSAPRIPVAWNAAGGPGPGAAPDAAYWRRHLREPVRFADGLAGLWRDGHRIFLEIGPHPVLAALAARSLPEGEARLLGSLRRGKDDWEELLGAVAELYALGAPVDFAGLDRPYRRRRLALPTYPFQRRQFWVKTGSGPARHAGPPAPAGSLLGARLGTATPIFESTLRPDSAPWLLDHRVQGAVLVAGPVFLELAQAAAREALGPAARAVEAFAIHAPLVLAPEGRAVQVQLSPGEGGAVPFTVHGRPAEGEGEWTLHASGRLVAAGAPELAEAAAPAGLAAVDPAAHYARLEAMAIQLGPAFRSIREGQRRDGEALATLSLAPERAGDPVAWAHPCLLDGALQAIGLAMADPGPDVDLHLFSGVERIELWGPLPARVRCHVTLREGAGAHEVLADVALRAEDGTPAGRVTGARLRRARRDALARVAGGATTAFYEVRWEPAPVRAHPRARLAGPAAFLPAVRERFGALAAEHGLAVYDALLPELDRLSAAYAAAALQALGFDPSPGRRFEVEDEAARLGVAPRHQRLLARLLALLAEDGVLRRAGAAYEVAGPLGAAAPADLHARAAGLAARFPASEELRTLARCGPELARVLRGEQDPVQLLFFSGGLVPRLRSRFAGPTLGTNGPPRPMEQSSTGPHPGSSGGAVDALRALYVDAPSARTYNGALAEALGRAAAGLPADARLRVIELGGGTGGTTATVLPRLPAGRVEYTFTDVSPVFLDRAAEVFAPFPFVRRALLDVEREPRAQGFEEGAYDVVIAANVLHATADLRRTVEHARRLLAPEGLLLLLEGTAPERWVDLTFGLTEGWWRFADPALRPDYPLVSREGWLRLLAELGFTEAAAVPERPDAAGRGGQQALLVARAPARHRRVLLVGPAGGVADAVAARLRAAGDEVALSPAGAAEPPPGRFDEVLYLGALPLADLGADDAAAPARARELAGTTALRWLARVARGEVGERIWLVTRGAAAAGEVNAGGAWQAPLWGLGRGFALEHPARWGGLLDLPPVAEPAEAAELLEAALDAGDGEDQVAFRGGARLAARLVPAARPAASLPPLRADATYLVTGGFGGLGLLVARWLAERGARHVALAGRRPDPASPGVRAVEAAGARVIPLAADVADEASLAAALARLEAEAPPLAGIVHAAAHLGAARLEALEPAEVEAMLRPKVDGTVLLDRLTRGKALDFLVLFSSTTALLGATGLAHYAAANTFLDAFAHAARRRGRGVVSVNWGTWEAMRLADADSQRFYREVGLEPMPAAEALDALGRAAGAGVAQLAVARIDWGVLKPVHEARRARPFLAHLHGAEPARPAARADAAPSLPALLAACAPSARQDALVEFVRSEVAAVLSAPEPGAIGPDAGLFEMGMDSLMSVELRRRLERAAGRSLPATLTFNYPNARALAGFLHGVLGAAAPAAAAPRPEAPPAPREAITSLADDELEARLRAKLERHR